jgi:TetR/AcrR family transcriptional regulator, regulator of autoinduction and epiphytic fitness
VSVSDLDPRQVRTRQRVYAAARSVLRREGVGGATFDSIAAEAGVARSTLYRNWATCNDLLAESFDDIVGDLAPSRPHRSIRTQLTRVLTQMAEALAVSEWGKTLPAIVATIEANPALAAHYGRLIDERRGAVAEVIDDAIARGELAATLPTDDLIDALVGPLFYRRLIRRTTTSPAWARRHVERTLAAFNADTAPAPTMGAP